jgi:hypothetical protein
VIYFHLSSIGVVFNFGGRVTIRPSPDQGLLKMPPPSSGADLQRFLCAINWMRTAIPPFSTLLSTPHTLLELVYARAGDKRTKAAVSRITLSELRWTGAHAQVFENFKVGYRTRRPSLIPRPTNASSYTPMLLRTFGSLSLPRSYPRIWISRRNNNGISPSHFSPGLSPDPCDGGPSLKRRHTQ